MSETLKQIRAAYPPLITFQEAAEIGRVSVKTVHKWSRHLDHCKVGKGNGTRLALEPYLAWLFDKERDIKL